MSDRIVSDIVLTLILAAMLGLAFNVPPFSAIAQETCGSRHDKGLEISFFNSSSEAFTALKFGEIDFMQWSLTYEQYQYVVVDPTLV
ncbi:hypothetical protein KAU30_03675, partial [Candidatus Bathyarchaeota archaeon]|nr:hypothetical protein [Candidatus Bathyarchaeota archaeon]